MPHNSNGKGIVLIGNGGHARAVRDVIESLNGYSISLGGRPEIVHVVEDTRKLQATQWAALASEYNSFVVSVGQIKTAQPRIDIVSALNDFVDDSVWVTLISPQAYVSPTAKIGIGTVIMHDAVVNAGAKVGAFCIINTSAIIEHDAEVLDFCHISTNAVVNGGAEVDRCSFVGSGAIVLNQIKIGHKVVLGAGSVACCDIMEPGIYRGNPAGRVK